MVVPGGHWSTSRTSVEHFSLFFMPLEKLFTTRHLTWGEAKKTTGSARSQKLFAKWFQEAWLNMPREGDRMHAATEWIAAKSPGFFRGLSLVGRFGEEWSNSMTPIVVMG
jgi:hypothetical protein